MKYFLFKHSNLWPSLFVKIQKCLVPCVHLSLYTLIFQLPDNENNIDIFPRKRWMIIDIAVGIAW
jgi:hypothetical protein